MDKNLKVPEDELSENDLAKEGIEDHRLKTVSGGEQTTGGEEETHDRKEKPDHDFVWIKPHG